MKLYNQTKLRAFSLFEVILAILLVAIVSGTIMKRNTSSSKADAFKVGQILRQVQQAQRAYLIDHASEGLTVADLAASAADFQANYFPGGVLPELPSIEGATLTINFTVQPPVVTNGGTTYDPSASTSDGQWDVGQ